MRAIKFITLLLIMPMSITVFGQNLIGYHEKAIRTYMKENFKNMNFLTFVNNPTFKYLKYSDNNETQTLMFFLAADSICRSERLICDMELKNAKIKELDTIYKKKGINTWTEMSKGKNYIIELKDEEWTFSVTIRLNE
jgi:hypothetical protein